MCKAAAPRHLLALALAMSPVVGCESRPHAPALQDEPVYQNAREGFRFLVPEGWKQYARADVPPGMVTKERLLVAYRVATPTTTGELEVTLADLLEETDLGKYLSGPTHGIEKWQRTGGPEKLDVNGVPAVRYAFTGRSSADKMAMTKEVTAFRRGDRVYFFTGLFRPGDDRARDAVRQAVASVMWKG